MARGKDRTRQQIKGDGLPEIPVFRTATYARLSVQSDIKKSGSIESQQRLMRDYIRDREEFFLAGEYKDDGISGTRFDRKAFDSLLYEVRKGNINCIIVKDFSRFGRDHVEVGNYLEKIFPFLGVRFISINDGYDSFDRECVDKKSAYILKNLVNEYVAKDTSAKVASSYAAKQENGEYDGGRAPYGYLFADQGKTKFFVDEKPAGVVRDIFAWTMEGDSARAIVKRLTQKGINPPRAYQDTGAFDSQEEARRYWNENTVNAILKNVVYAGHMALHKWKESKADGISPCRLDESTWKVTENTHEAIVAEKDFKRVQKILRERRVRYESGNAMDENVIRPENLLKGKVFCGDCLVPASRMGTNYRRKGMGSKGVRTYRYRCRTYREKGAKECTSKSISEKDLENVVCQAVMLYIRQAESLDNMVLSFHSGFFQEARKRIGKEKSMAMDAIRQGRNEKIRLYEEYSRMKDSGNGDRSAGRERYFKEKEKQEAQIRYCEKRKAQLEEREVFLERLEKAQAGWIEEALAYKDTVPEEIRRELRTQLIAVFVDKIFLYDGKRVEVVLQCKDG